jgi:predicted DNA-binding mobile mystery protein A
MTMTKKPSNQRLQRSQLDKRFAPLRKANLTSPKSGWIRTIRTSLGMTATQLAKRVGVTPQSIKDYEKAEEAGTISVATLKKIATALECEPHVVLVPRESLEAIVRRQALKSATKIVSHADAQMKLEAQGTGNGFKKKQIQELAEEISKEMSRELWEE